MPLYAFENGQKLDEEIDKSDDSFTCSRGQKKELVLNSYRFEPNSGDRINFTNKEIERSKAVKFFKAKKENMQIPATVEVSDIVAKNVSLQWIIGIMCLNSVINGLLAPIIDYIFLLGPAS